MMLTNHSVSYENSNRQEVIEQGLKYCEDQIQYEEEILYWLYQMRQMFKQNKKEK